MTRGLTLGKYAPLHRGHQRVIETGLAETDEMIVIIYDSPQVTTVPLPVRAAWIRALYPTVQVIEAYGGPSAVGYTPELMRAHEHYIINTLGVRGISHFYSSEPYGEHMSRALGALDRRVDEARKAIPISASQIRRNPFACRDYLHPRVYRDLITHVVFLGAPCSGKSTLAERLAQDFETQWMPEYGREYWEQHQINRRLEPEQLVEIAEEHIRREDALLENSNRYLFTDTNALTTATFANYYHGRLEPRLASLAEQAVTRYDLVFVCAIDIPYDDTWDRSGEVNRALFQQHILRDLKQRQMPYTLLQGNLEERVAHVRRRLDNFSKYRPDRVQYPGALSGQLSRRHKA